MRAEQLTSVQERLRVAAALETAVRCAELGRGFTVHLKLREQAVLDEREALLELARRVSALAPVPPAVVAQLEWLLWDRRSPLYAGGDPPELIGHVAGRCLAVT